MNPTPPLLTVTPSKALIQPIYLLADSQLLFWKRRGTIFLDSIRSLLTKESPKAAYIGASNGDIPDYFCIFQAAVTSVGITHYRMIKSSYSTDDANFLQQADLILLSGGDVSTGWQTLTKTGMNNVIIERYYEGAVLIGTSAGAVQLGLYGCRENGPSNKELFETLKLIPFMVDTHDERRDWSSLRDTLLLLDNNVSGIGIPAGAGVAYHPNGDLEPIRFASDVFSVIGGRLEQNILLPYPEGAAQESLVPHGPINDAS